MNEENCMCYITYAVPRNMIPAFVQGEITPPRHDSLYPPDFVPEWYRRSSFPEDDTEE